MYDNSDGNALSLWNSIVAWLIPLGGRRYHKQYKNCRLGYIRLSLRLNNFMAQAIVEPSSNISEHATR